MMKEKEKKKGISNAISPLTHSASNKYTYLYTRIHIYSKKNNENRNHMGLGSGRVGSGRISRGKEQKEWVHACLFIVILLSLFM